jgi:hypothetical protein
MQYIRETNSNFEPQLYNTVGAVVGYTGAPDAIAGARSDPGPYVGGKGRGIRTLQLNSISRSGFPKHIGGMKNNNKITNERANKRTNRTRRANKITNKRTNRANKITNKRTNRANKITNRANKRANRANKRTNKRANKRANKRTNKRANKRTNRQ